jgi:hypothetical protein
VRAELFISHKLVDIVGVLEAAYGENDPTARDESKLAREGVGSVAGMRYAGRAPGLIVMAWTRPGRVEIYVESSTGRLRAAGQKVWEVVRETGTELSPTLQSLILFDPDENDVVAEAAIGVRQRIVGDQLFVPIITGIVTAIVLVVALVRGASQEFLYGSITALVVAILSLGRLALILRSKELKWR